MARAKRYLQSGSAGQVGTVSFGPPTGVLAAVSGAASFSGAGTVPAALTGTLQAVAQSASFSGAGSVGASSRVLTSSGGYVQTSSSGYVLNST
jgi:hypothetical protein